jgi:hypothetical protein
MILKGQMTVRLHGKILLLDEGDTLHIPANTIHSMWNNSGSTTIINWKIQPALTTEYFLETATGLASDRRRGRMRSLLQRALMANKYSTRLQAFQASFSYSENPFHNTYTICMDCGLPGFL